MSGFDTYEDMNDDRLKPGILKSLMSDNLPSSEIDPLPDSIDVAKIVHSINTFGLLSESSVQQNNNNSRLVEEWTHAVDAWIHCLLSLVSSPRAKRCWIGICLLGVSCQECSTDRFLASYSLWLDKLLLSFQRPASEYLSVKVASGASISHLLTRLAAFPVLKKDGVQHAGKLVPHILKLLNEDASEAVLVGAVGLMCTIMNFFPTSVHHYYESAKALIISKIVSARCSSHLLKEYAHCLALLPKSKGDEGTWSLMMQDLIQSINNDLNYALKGLEEDECYKTMKPPPQADPSTSFLNGLMSEESPYLRERRSKHLMATIIPAMMVCCCKMLTNTYPVPVNVPVYQLLMIVQRVLKVNGSLPRVSSEFMTTMQQEFVCAELPVLHMNSLELLTAITKGAHSHLVPYAAFVLRLLKGQFQKCILPELRIKVYSIIRTLLLSMGTGIALYISEEVISNAFADLETSSHRRPEKMHSPNSRIVASESHMDSRNKKRKYDHITGSAKRDEDRQTIEMDTDMTKSRSPVSVKIAALEALETLLTVGGVMKSELNRPKIDHLIVNVATMICEGDLTNMEENELVPRGEPNRADFRLAALRALLASLLSQVPVNSHYLFQALELFHKGKEDIGTKVAEFCAYALLALEVLMHPRFVPLQDNIPSSGHASQNEKLKHINLGNIYSDDQEIAASVSAPVDTGKLFPDDDIYNSWLGNGNDAEVTQSFCIEDIENAEVPPNAGLSMAIPSNQLMFATSISADIGSKNNQDETTFDDDVEMGKAKYVEAQTDIYPDPFSIIRAKNFADACTSYEMQLQNFVSDIDEVNTCHDIKQRKDELPPILHNCEVAENKISSSATPFPGKTEACPLSLINNLSTGGNADIRYED